MDVRSIDRCQREYSHDIIPVWWLVRPEEMRRSTQGGYLEYVTEFEVQGGDEVELHSHPSHEFYYVLTGRGVMVIDDEECPVQQGDLIYIPPDAMHSLRPVSDQAAIRCFSFATSVGTEDSHYR